MPELQPTVADLDLDFIVRVAPACDIAAGSFLVEHFMLFHRSVLLDDAWRFLRLRLIIRIRSDMSTIISFIMFASATFCAHD